MVYNVYIYMYNVGGIGIKLKKRVSFKQIMTMLFIKAYIVFNRVERKIVSPRINNE